MALANQKKIVNLTKFNMIFTPEIQPQLLDFVGDAFIVELLPNITRYLHFSERKEHYKHALQKAGETLRQLKRFSAEAKKYLETHGL